MKKSFLAFLLSALFAIPSFAQQSSEHDAGIFSHLGLSFAAGTNGITFDAGTNITKYVGIRAGVDWIPSFAKFSTSADVNINLVGLTISKIDLDGDLGRLQGHLLADIFPFGRYFCFTTGFYFGGKDLLELKGSSSEVADYIAANPAQAGLIKAIFSGYELNFNDDGSIEAFLRTNSFRPYFGVGIGCLDAPARNRVSARLDLGLQYMGEPQIFVGNKRIKPTEVQDGSTKKLGYYLDQSYTHFYPVAQLAIRMRIF